MPLYSMPTLQVIERVPHERENRPIIDRIAHADMLLIVEELNRRIDAVIDSPDELITSGWIPGRDWSGTVWHPIYEAARHDVQRAGMVFGAIVFGVMIDRLEAWSLGKYQVDGRDIGSVTYYRINL